MEHAHLLLFLACSFGFFMAWGIGANDVANAMGTAVGSRSLTIKQAIVVAAIFETAGAILAGGQVADTMRKGIIDPELFSATPEILVYGMLASLLASATWLLIASYRSWPVSTTHSIVGAIIGFGLIQLGAQAIDWSVVTSIGLSWIVTPIIAGIIAYMIFYSVLKLILTTDEPLANAKRYLPAYVFITAFVVTMVTFTKGLKHLNLPMSLFESLSYSALISVIISIIGIIALKRMHIRATKKHKVMYSVEKVFALLMVFTACAMAFAHGSNDIANAIGPMAAVVSIVTSGGLVSATSSMPIWILFFGAIGIVAGLAMYGHKVIATIGQNITELTPSRGFAASLATSVTVVLASGTGLPISTTQTLVGAVLGVGLARGMSALNLRVIRGIFMSWVITLPVGALLAVLYFWLLRLVL